MLINRNKQAPDQVVSIERKCLKCTLYYECCNWFITKNWFSWIKSLVGHLQFMVRQKHNLVGHLILPQIYPIGQSDWCFFCLVGQLLILAGHCPMSDHYFKAWSNHAWLKWNREVECIEKLEHCGKQPTNKM